jgi:hypothetical protein
MAQEEPGYANWSAVEKEPTPVMMASGGGGHHPGHAGAALRALGSIWLVTLMFLFLVLAAISVSNWAFTSYQLKIDSAGTKMDSAGEDRLKRVNELMDYKKELDARLRIVSDERSVALKPPSPVPSLWNEIVGWQKDNESLRKAGTEAIAVAKKKSNPNEPLCRDPTNRLGC